LEENNVLENTTTEIVKVRKSELCILVTDEDKHGTDIIAMSNFFDGYIQQLSCELSKNPIVEVISEFPAANIGIINDVLHHANAVMKGEFSYIPDFDRLPKDIKSKFEKGIYTIGESKQVDGNARAVILDENGIRIKDVTLKKVQNQIGTIDTAKSIVNQAQMRQIYAKLDGIEELQEYQIERDRDRDIVTPFLNARQYILLAQESDNEEYRIEQLKKANMELTGAINAVYTEMSTASKHLAKLTSRPIFQRRKQIETYMGYLTSDLQIATKFVGVQMHVYDYLGDKRGSTLALENYQHVMSDFVNKVIDKKGQSAAILLQNNYPYDKSNMDFWFNFTKEIQPVLKSSISKIESKDVYLVSVEDIKDE
jgi:hypothetical protein